MLKVKIVRSAPWFDTEYKEVRKQRRKAEKQFKHSGNLRDKELYKHLRKQTTALALQKKQQYFTSQINEAKNKPKALFKMVNSLLDSKQESVFPIAESVTELANKFQFYFKDKITKIRESFTVDTKTSPTPLPENVQLLNTFYHMG